MAAEPVGTLTAPAEPASLDRVHALLEAVWTAHEDVLPADRMPFALAVTEVAGNIVQHAGDGHPLAFSLHVDVRPEVLTAEFEDPGRRVDVDLTAVSLPGAAAESGRGLALALRCVDHLEYRRDGGTNRWRLLRRRADS